MSARPPLLLLFVPALVACSLDRDEFIERFAAVNCEKSQECYPDEFVATFESIEDCADFYVDFFAYIPDDEDGCVYDGAAARDCLNAAKDITCDDDDIDAACDEVFTGDGCTISYVED